MITLFTSLTFLGAAVPVRPAGYLFILSAVTGMLGLAVYPPLVPCAALCIFFTIGAITLIGLGRPDWIFNGSSLLFNREPV